MFKNTIWNKITQHPKNVKKRQTEHVLDLPSVAVIAHDHLVFGFGNKKNKDNNTMITINVGY